MLDDATLAERLYGAPPTPDSAPAPAATMAERLFGPSAAESAPSPADPERQPRTDDELAGMFSKAPAELPAMPVPTDIRELRDADPDRRMFSPQQTLAEAIPESAFADSEGVDPATRTAVTMELREIAADLDLGAVDIRQMRDRASRLAAEPVGAASQQESAIAALNAAFGQTAKQALDDARALVARDQRVGKLIDAMGLGNDPDTILALAHAARRQRAAGKLK